MITRYGYDVFFTITTFCIILVIIAFIFVEPKTMRYLLVTLSVVIFGFTVNFFRDPDRITPDVKSKVIAPADGKIVSIKTQSESEYMKCETSCISIFMSPLNVHVNRNPISGTIEYVRYVKGEYFAAFEEKASEKNEQVIVGAQNSFGKVLFKQIAGFIARRIVCTLKIGEEVKAGERFGMIKFGSRVDVFVPATAAVRVSIGDLTSAGETILAEFAEPTKGERKK